MITRKIKPCELKRSSELFRIAFEFPKRDPKSAKEVAEQILNNPANRNEKYHNIYASFLDDNTTMISSLTAVPYTVQFDDNTVKLSGIGGVSTLPQYRKHGGIRAIFEKSLPEMYNEGYAFSYLYPFSTGYYRKFGYEITGEIVHYYIDLRSIKQFDEANGECYLLEGNNDINDIKSIYDDFRKGYNMMSLREDNLDYNSYLNASPAENGVYTYIYKSKEGKPKGYMSFTKEKKNDYYTMLCKEFFFSDFDGLKGLLNMATTFSTYYKEITFRLPHNINITSFIPEWAMYACDRKVYFNGMIRVVNVKEVLQKAKYIGSGNIRIRIFDSIIKENDNCFLVEFDNGRAKSITLTADELPDVEMNVSDFSRLIVGNFDMEEINYIEKIKVNSEKDILAKIFYKKPCFNAEYF